MKHGINVLAPKFFAGKKPDLAVAGFNVGWNIGLANKFSGTYGAALMADSMSIPAIAFSGRDGMQIPWDTDPRPHYVELYSDLAVKIIDTLVANPKPWVDEGSFIGVNFPAVGWTKDDKPPMCTKVEDFKFILTATAGVGIRWPWNHGKDVPTCGQTTLPKEQEALLNGWMLSLSGARTDGCWVTISVLDRKRDNASKDKQSTVKENLRSILSCLPGSKGPL
ncbi:hypothetical protein MBLNU457_g0616t1 [Dothideomycetes sp. NU457]